MFFLLLPSVHLGIFSVVCTASGAASVGWRCKDFLFFNIEVNFVGAATEVGFISEEFDFKL